MTQEEVIGLIILLVIIGVIMRVLKGETKVVCGILVLLAGVGVLKTVCPHKLINKPGDVNEVIAEHCSEDYVKLDDNDQLQVNIYDNWYNVSDISSVKNNMDNSYTVKVDGHSYTVNNSELAKVFENLGN